jgi:hypothetical protein
VVVLVSGVSLYVVVVGVVVVVVVVGGTAAPRHAASEQFSGQI